MDYDKLRDKIINDLNESGDFRTEAQAIRYYELNESDLIDEYEEEH